MVWSGAGCRRNRNGHRWAGSRWNALDHPIAESRDTGVFYSGDDDQSATYCAALADVAADMEIGPVPGRHRGYDSIMEPPRVETIATDLERRLRRT